MMKAGDRLDDRVIISDEIRSMSKEQLKAEIQKLEAEEKAKKEKAS